MNISCIAKCKFSVYSLVFVELSSDNSWVPMLVVVALGSAMLGAVLMITALKCRR